MTFNPTCSFPVPTDSVEIVYSSHFLEHIDDATVDRVLVESRRCLKSGGLLVIKIPDFEMFLDAFVSESDEVFRDLGMDAVSTTWSRHGISDSLDSRFTMMFCGYMNEDYGHHFVNAGRSAHANAFHGPPKVDGPTLRTLVARYRDSPHELAAHLKKLAESQNEVFRWNHQNAWSRKELSDLLHQNGFSEIEFSSVNFASLRKRIPDFQVMEDWSMYMVASLLET